MSAARWLPWRFLFLMPPHARLRLAAWARQVLSAIVYRYCKYAMRRNAFRVYDRKCILMKRPVPVHAYIMTPYISWRDFDYHSFTTPERFTTHYASQALYFIIVWDEAMRVMPQPPHLCYFKMIFLDRPLIWYYLKATGLMYIYDVCHTLIRTFYAKCCVGFLSISDFTLMAA